MVALNVAQLLKSVPGTTREYDLKEPLPDPADELHLAGPVAIHLRLTRTSRGILVHADYQADAVLECSRCLDEVRTNVADSFEEEFLQTADLHTGMPVADEQLEEAETPRLNEHHELVLDDILRQNILTSLPFQPLCDIVCPGLCPTCGVRLDAQHQPHAADEAEAPAPVDPASPFARLASLLDSAPDASRN